MTLMDTAVSARIIWLLYCKSCSGATVIKREVAPMISHKSFEMTAVRHRRLSCYCLATRCAGPHISQPKLLLKAN